MELFAQTQQKSRLGQILLDKRLVSQEQLSKAMEQQATTGERLGDILTQWNVVTQRHIESALRAQRNLRLVASLVTAMATPFITACGGGGGGETSPTTQNSAAQSTATAVQSVPIAIAAATPVTSESTSTNPASTVTGWVIKESVCCAPVTNSSNNSTATTIPSATATPSGNSTATQNTIAPNSTLMNTVIPTDLMAKASGPIQVNLTWKDNSSGTVKYRIFRDNVAIDETTGSSYSDYTVDGTKAYTYQVRAIDSINVNVTAGQSNAAGVTTPVDPDASTTSTPCMSPIV